jgi:hypothetical protein
MRNETLITHKPIAIVATTFLLFQMAMLQTHILSFVLFRWMAEDVHAKHDQEFSGGNGRTVADLRKKVLCILSSGTGLQERVERVLTANQVITALGWWSEGIQVRGADATPTTDLARGALGVQTNDDINYCRDGR